MCKVLLLCGHVTFIAGTGGRAISVCRALLCGYIVPLADVVVGFSTKRNGIFLVVRGSGYARSTVQREIECLLPLTGSEVIEARCRSLLWTAC